MGKSIFDNEWLSTELKRFEIKYDKLSINDDTVVASATSTIEQFLQKSSYHRYIRIRLRKYKFIEPTKYNECIAKCAALTRNALQLIDVFDAINTYYELDTKLCWDQLSYTNKLIIAKDMLESQGNDALLKFVMQQKAANDMLDQ